jgi:hypothetical protein
MSNEKLARILAESGLGNELDELKPGLKDQVIMLGEEFAAKCTATYVTASLGNGAMRISSDLLGNIKDVDICIPLTEGNKALLTSCIKESFNALGELINVKEAEVRNEALDQVYSLIRAAALEVEMDAEESDETLN